MRSGSLPSILQVLIRCPGDSRLPKEGLFHCHLAGDRGIDYGSGQLIFEDGRIHREFRHINLIEKKSSFAAFRPTNQASLSGYRVSRRPALHVPGLRQSDLLDEGRHYSGPRGSDPLPSGWRLSVSHL
jgi:hypothetical protein